MKKLFYILIISLVANDLSAQIKIGDNTSSINSRSLLELESTTKAILLPRLTTTQQNAQSDWKAGMFVYNTTDSCIEYFNGNLWQKVGASNNVAYKNVYCNNVNPNSATIFDDVLPLVANDVSLKANYNNTYFGSDGSAWIWNGTVYITYKIDLNLNIGERTSIVRFMATTAANGTILTGPDLIELDNMIRVDIVKASNTFYNPRIVNISGGTLNITYQTLSTIPQNEDYINQNVANGTALEVDADNICYWTTTNSETVFTNLILPNGKWYEIQWFAYEVGTSKRIYMSVLRKF